MADTQARDELHRLVDELPDDDIHKVLTLARAVASPDRASTSKQRPAWIGAGHHGSDYASRAKDILREQMGQQDT